MADAVENFGTEADRDQLFLEMAWEIDCIARTMPDAVPVGDDQAHFLVRALCGRMLRLTSVMMELAQKDSTPERSFAQSRALVMVEGITQG